MVTKSVVFDWIYGILYVCAHKSSRKSNSMNKWSSISACWSTNSWSLSSNSTALESLFFSVQIRRFSFLLHLLNLENLENRSYVLQQSRSHQCSRHPWKLHHYITMCSETQTTPEVQQWFPWYLFCHPEYRYCYFSWNRLSETCWKCSWASHGSKLYIVYIVMYPKKLSFWSCI